MRWGLFSGGEVLSVDEHVARARAVSAAGLDAMFFGQVGSWDAIGLAGVCGREAPGIEVGVAVTQTFPRHPLALAAQALTTQAISGNRFTLGVGPSHPAVIEGQFGLAYDRPAQHTREYLEALTSLLDGRATEYRGERITAVGRVDAPGAERPSLLLSALGPVMLRIAGELADGTTTVWAGPRVIGEHVAPLLNQAAQAAGRPTPRIVALVVAALTGDPDAARAHLSEQFAMASQMPAYQEILGRQGKTSVGDTLVAGDEKTLERELRAYADAGTTDLLVSPFGDAERMIEFLGSIR
ncbi:TIGR03564 family F420-dependent LLM class oxidoreductase [Catenulispora sp. NF23]|nr:TIGR03564 family F420-dependent LLM class oxidoreductase [Catenulispora pinistramenti]